METAFLQTKEGLVSFCTSARSLPQQFRRVLASLLQSPGLPFADALSEEAIEAAFQEEGVAFGQEDDEVYAPALTLWAFLSQMLFKDEQRSCVAAVSRIIVLLVSLGRRPCSDNTGAYCRARAKLSERVLCRLTYQVADGCEASVPHSWRWKGLSVCLRQHLHECVRFVSHFFERELPLPRSFYEPEAISRLDSWWGAPADGVASARRSRFSWTSATMGDFRGESLVRDRQRIGLFEQAVPFYLDFLKTHRGLAARSSPRHGCPCEHLAQLPPLGLHAGCAGAGRRW